MTAPAGCDRPAGAPRPSPAGPSFDAIVVGLGALGSAAARSLAGAGARVLGLEQFGFGHHRGASHDHARIIRRSYHTPGYVRLAAGHGATLMANVPVTAVRDLGTAVEVTAAGSSFRGGRLLLCADAWTGGLLAQLGAELPLVVTQEQYSYFRPADPAGFAVGRFPVWIWMDDPSFYGFPVWPGDALKAAQDVAGREVTADGRSFAPDPAGFERLAGFLRARLPGAAGAHDRTRTCLYTLTPDRDLVLGPLPGHDRVLGALGAAHGFKFAPLIGRALADLALHGGSDLDLAPFAADRPALASPAPEPNYLV